MTSFLQNCREPESIGVLLLPGFAFMTFASTIEPLRQANRLAGVALYQWKILSVDGRPVASSAGPQLSADASIHDDIATDRLFVCAGDGVEKIDDQRLLARLRALDRAGIPVGAVSTATFILARAGLLQQRRCTIHWEYLPSFREAFPEIDVRATVYEEDRGRITCGGSTACLDLMVHLIAQRHGLLLAEAIANEFNVEQLRASDDDQASHRVNRAGIRSRTVHRVVSTMESHLESPLDLDALAKVAGVSSRQIERIFQKHFDTSVMKYYKVLRLNHARRLLRQSSLPVSEIAVASGFSSLSNFNQSYKIAFGCPPGRDRTLVVIDPSEGP